MITPDNTRIHTRFPNRRIVRNSQQNEIIKQQIDEMKKIEVQEILEKRDN